MPRSAEQQEKYNEERRKLRAEAKVAKEGAAEKQRLRKNRTERERYTRNRQQQQQQQQQQQTNMSDETPPPPRPIETPRVKHYPSTGGAEGKPLGATLGGDESCPVGGTVGPADGLADNVGGAEIR
jgi:transcription initiation factor TFIID subunit TAF12